MSAYARSVATVGDDGDVEPMDERSAPRTPVRVPGEALTGDHAATDAPSEEYELPDIVPAGPRTEATPIVPGVDDGAATEDLPATEPLVRTEPRVAADLREAASVAVRRPGSRHRVRRVTRVVRHIDPWSAFKVGAVFSLVTYVVGLTAGVLLWRVADSTGTLGNIERWFTQFGWETFELKGDEVFDAARTIGLFLAVGLTGLMVLLATLFNLVSDMVGGFRVSVLEEESLTESSS